MKILASWLREFIDTKLSPQEIQTALTMAGVEVSSCRFLGDGLDDVVVAKILSKDRHPNADKLSLCRVTDGEREYPIVCGAQNHQVGDLVALAKIGAKLPNGIEIKKAKIRGESSEGMLCSEAELRLAESSDGIIVLAEGEAAPGASIADALGLSDWLLEIEVTPNRGDALSVLGLARELSCITGEPLLVRESSVGDALPAGAAVTVTDTDLCPRYTARVVEGVRVGPSPAWMRRRLALCGIRPHNNVVDVTNYILLELGQPMHAFDLDRLEGGKIDVRRSGVARTFRTLDGVERKVGSDALLIWDGKGPVAVAGIMGGENSEVVERSTTRILFESAHFAPSSVRGTARSLGLSTDASYRFERGVDPSGTLRAANRAVDLLARTGTVGTVHGPIDIGGGRDFRRSVPFRPARASAIVGRDYTEAEIREIFRRLRFDVAVSGPGLWSVSVLPHRTDIEREIDLVEEVARLAGYDSIPTTYPSSGAPDFSADDRFQALSEKAASLLVSLGFSQAINYSFVSEDELSRHAVFFGFEPADAMRLRNPLSAETTMMRPNLLSGLLKNLSLNKRFRAADVRFFEFGKAFGKSMELSHYEEPRLGVVMCGQRIPEGWSAQDRASADFFDLKGVVSGVLSSFGAGTCHFFPSVGRPFFQEGRGAEVIINGEVVAWLGLLRRDLLDAFEISVPVLFAEIRSLAVLSEISRPPKHLPVSRFQPIDRDIACVLPAEVASADVAAMVRELGCGIESVSVFDVFVGEKIGDGKKSVAFRVRIQPTERTLTEEEVQGIHSNIVELLKNRFGGRIRS